MTECRRLERKADDMRELHEHHRHDADGLPMTQLA